MKHLASNSRLLLAIILVAMTGFLVLLARVESRAAASGNQGSGSYTPQPIQLPTLEPPKGQALIDAWFDPVPGSGKVAGHLQSEGIKTMNGRTACASRMPHTSGLTPHVELDTLVVIYTNTAMGTLSDADLLRLQQYISKTAVFIWRQSHLKLRLNITYMVINDYKDITEFTVNADNAYWLYPDDGDKDGSSVENDLISRGVLKDQYDSINYFWPHIDYGLQYGGLGGLISWSLGLTGITENPIAWWFAGPDGTVAFDHEIQHTLDAMFETSGYADYYNPDRPWFLSGVFGGEWDLPRSAMDRVPMEKWFVFCEPWGTVVNSPDEDNDNVPDAAIGNFPTEATLGGSSSLRDTDGDGLEDLDETMAGILRNSSLSNVDSDSDGRIDGNDLYPLFATETQVLQHTHTLDGNPASWDVLTTHLAEQNAPFSASVSTNWDANYFYIMIIEDRYAEISIQLDAQNDGWFHGKDNYEIYGINPSAADPDVINTAHIWDSSDESIATNIYPMWDDDPNYPFGRLVNKDDILRHARPYGSGFLLQLAIPRNETTGLVPSAGKRIGLLVNFIYLDRQGETHAHLWDWGAFLRPVLVAQRDNTPPVSQMEPLPGKTGHLSFEIRWNGTDSGSGVWYYDVQYRDGDGGQWVNWLTKTSAGSTTFIGQVWHTYHFRVRAWDQAGNVETWRPNGDAWTRLEVYQLYLPHTVKDYRPTVSVTIPGQLEDGESYFMNCSLGWTACRNSKTGSGTWSGLSQSTVAADLYNGKYTIERAFLFFDTSSIPANAEIASSSLKVYAGQWQTENELIHVVRSTAGIPLSANDYGKVEFVSGGSATFAIPSTWATFNLNPVGQAWIIRGGFTKLALIHDNDLLNIAPVAPNNVLISTAEDPDHRPSLVVTYYK